VPVPHEATQKLVAVFTDQRAADAAVEAVRRSGVAAASIAVGSSLDERTALQGEMREEMEHTTAGPGNIGPFTKEMSKGLSVGTLIGIVVGVALAVPFAFFTFTDESLVIRLIIAASVGAAAGATVGFVGGGGFAAKSPNEELAAERGVTISITDPPESVVGVLERFDPIRIDIVRGAQPVDTAATEEDETGDGAMGRLRSRIVDGGEGDWTASEQRRQQGQPQ
jgi:hypothetical protein